MQGAEFWRWTCREGGAKKLCFEKASSADQCRSGQFGKFGSHYPKWFKGISQKKCNVSKPPDDQTARKRRLRMRGRKWLLEKRKEKEIIIPSFASCAICFDRSTCSSTLRHFFFFLLSCPVQIFFSRLFIILFFEAKLSVLCLFLNQRLTFKGTFSPTELTRQLERGAFLPEGRVILSARKGSCARHIDEGTFGLFISKKPDKLTR